MATIGRLPDPNAAHALTRLADALTEVAGLPDDLDQRSAEVAVALRVAGDRLAAEVDDVLVAVVGPTGSGRSSLLNAIVGREVSPTGVLRPTTAAPVVWTARARASSYRRGGLAGLEAEVVATDDPIAARLTLVDAPDPDSLVRSHAATLRSLVGAVDLVIPVTTPARYADAVPWAVVARALDLGLPLMPVMNRVRDDREGRLQVGHLVARAAIDGVDIDLEEVVRIPERPGIGVLAADVAELRDVLVEVGETDAALVAAYARYGAAADAVEAASDLEAAVETIASTGARTGRRAAAAASAERVTIADELLASPPGAGAHGSVLLRLRDKDDEALAAVEGRLVAATAADLVRRFGGDPAGRAADVRVAAAAVGADEPAETARLLLATTAGDDERLRGFANRLAAAVVPAPVVVEPTVPDRLGPAVAAARAAVPADVR